MNTGDQSQAIVEAHAGGAPDGRPHQDALRSTAWAVVTCAEVHRPQVAAIENVREFANWSLYPAWCGAMHALGYALAPMVLDAADHGVPQHWQRLVIVATRSRHPIELKLPRRERRAAADCIDMDAGRWSPIQKVGRSTRTLARIASGRPRFGDRAPPPRGQD
ncbi:DNA cytosine methyltransferase [Roseateles amylovorans]|uniref:DNA cytosine methyltransferase n=2 Tax=Roseateles amylovorans TaxID=2978473 RepID=A0ABY6B3N7_9BURK|nr:DNA cytosine methyltransferase [Roseateles amylovorans]UXH79996.1 DNA cytosine methyltransferase [Roseateles amylovorans]